MVKAPVMSYCCRSSNRLPVIDTRRAGRRSGPQRTHRRYCIIFVWVTWWGDRAGCTACCQSTTRRLRHQPRDQALAKVLAENVAGEPTVRARRVPLVLRTRLFIRRRQYRGEPNPSTRPPPASARPGERRRAAACSSPSAPDMTMKTLLGTTGKRGIGLTCALVELHHLVVDLLRRRGGRCRPATAASCPLLHFSIPVLFSVSEDQHHPTRDQDIAMLAVVTPYSRDERGGLRTLLKLPRVRLSN